LVKTYQNVRNIPNDPILNIPNGHKILQMVINLETFSIPRL
jgi:hypothetical protein